MQKGLGGAAPEQVGQMDHPESIDGHAVLEFLGHGGMGWVYRVAEPETGREVALKLLRTAVAVTLLDKLRFEREFEVVRGLEHPSLVAVFDKGVVDNQPYYTMELVAGPNIRDFLNRERERPTREAWLARLGTLIARLTEGLAYIHQHNIIHRDLKPENILIDPSGTPRLLDFGLARRREASTFTEPGTVIGTVHYMSPEQIAGHELDSRTDLYSLGVILYELLSGRLPFDSPELVSVLYAILHEPPVPLHQHCPWLPQPVVEMTMRLLEKEPADRFQSAAELLEELNHAFGTPVDLIGPEPLPVAHASPPEQLFTPRFVGRDQELRQVLERLDRLHERGALVLVEGVSGVGKTRFLQELAGQARSLGLACVWGYGNEVEALPYNPWIRILRRSLKNGLPAELEVFRDALSVLFPELGEPHVDREDPLLKFHLFEGMVRLLARMASHRGLVVFLEDLQWADPASLEFLHYAGRSLLGQAEESLPIAIVTSCRDELVGSNDAFMRVRASLVRLEGMDEIPLDPLSQEQTAAVVSSMLGQGTVEPETQARLFHETEGNPLFIAEILKTFVAEGRLRLDRGSWNLESTALPRTSAGGSRIPVTVRDAVERRLAGLDPGDLRVARQAAVLGRTFEFEVLARAWNIPQEELIDRVERLVGRKILTEARERGFLTFYNQPILEVLLEGTPADLQVDLHARAARALEGLANPERQAARLAHHYRLSGQGSQAVIHLVRAGDASAQAFAYLEAADLYQRALDIPEVETVLSRRELQEKLADANYGAGLTEMALETYTWLLGGVKDSLEHARLLRKLGTCWERLGDLRQAQRCLKDALKQLGIKLPSMSFLATIGIPFRQLGQFLRKKAVVPGYRKDLRRTDEMERVLERLTRVLFFLRPEGWVLDTLDMSLRQQFIARVLNSREAAGQAKLFSGYSILFFPRVMMPHARRQLRVAADMARELGDSLQKAAFLRESGYLLFVVGDVRNALVLEMQALELSQRLGDIHGLALNHTVLQLISRYRGRLDEAFHHALKAREYAESTSSKVDFMLSLINMGHIAALRGEVAEANRHLAQAERRARKLSLPFLTMLIELARGWTYFAEGCWQDALECGETSTRTCKLRHAPYYMAESRLLEACATVRLARDRAGREKATQRIKAARIESSGLYPLFEAILRRLEGEMADRAGRQEEALAAYQEALETFEVLQNPLEQANSHRLLAAYFQVRDPVLAEKHREAVERCLQEAGAIPRIREVDPTL
ncbi:MAG: hypothetical protein AMXMBFR33_31390 [Candidatus Xenobia bacterium]